MTYQTGNTTQDSSRSGGNALVELGGLVVIAIVAMSLLAFGYNSNAAAPAPNQSMTTPANPADQMSVPTLPRADGANTPAAPTTSTTGVGPSNGKN